jgi:hypothetical protein
VFSGTDKKIVLFCTVGNKNENLFDICNTQRPNVLNREGALEASCTAYRSGEAFGGGEDEAGRKG